MKALLKNQFTIAAFIWTIIFGTYLLYPGKSDPFQMTGFFLSLIFCALFMLPLALLPGKIEINQIAYTVDEKKLQKICRVSFYIAMTGLFFHLWDKIGLRHYNYISCDDIREQWLNDGVGRKNSISSWQSALGHLLTYFSIVPVIFSDLKNRSSKFIFALSCLFFIVYCWTIVSRSSLLAFSVLSVASYHHFYVNNQISGKEFIKRTATLFSILFLFIFLSFFKKIACTDQNNIAKFTAGSMKEHKLSFEASDVASTSASQFDFENKTLDPFFKKIKTSIELSPKLFKGDQRSSYVINAIPLYMGNGINNFSHVTNATIENDKKFIFNPIINSFNRIAGRTLIELSTLRNTFDQGFINLPGAVFLTFGKASLYLFPLFLGFALRFFYLASKNNILLVPITSFCQSFIILAPLTNLTSNMSTPFLFIIAVSLAAISISLKIVSKKC